jgi:hypothetical protein
MSQASGKALLVVLREMLLDECGLDATEDVETASQQEEELAIRSTMGYCFCCFLHPAVQREGIPP